MWPGDEGSQPHAHTPLPPSERWACEAHPAGRREEAVRYTPRCPPAAAQSCCLPVSLRQGHSLI